MNVTNAHPYFTCMHQSDPSYAYFFVSFVLFIRSYHSMQHICYVYYNVIIGINTYIQIFFMSDAATNSDLSNAAFVTRAV